MNKYFPAHIHSDSSLLDGLSKPKNIAKRIVELGLDGCSLTDHGNVSNAVSFVKEMTKVEKKWVLGSELYICEQDASIKTKDNRSLTHLVVLAKNLAGWRSLIKLTSQSNTPELLYYKPRLDVTRLAEHTKDGNLVSFSGHLGSAMASVLFDAPKLAFNSKTEQEAKSLLKVNWDVDAKNLALDYLNLFGKGNFYLEIQLIDKECLPCQIVVANCLRQISQMTGIPCVATPDAHYCKKEDSADQRILLCTNLKTSLATVEAKIENDEDVMLGGFFKSNNYHIPSYEEMCALHTKEELENTLRIAEQCEQYNILSKPILPPFDCPSGNSEEYLRQLCRDGWANKIKGKIPKYREQEYADRVKYELGVLQGAGLSSYFLIVQDIVGFVRKNKWMTSPGRGSAAGCLVSYLVGITGIDPIPYGLIFERFYNAGRNTATKVSMPDVDIDVPVQHRETIIEYIKNKYGHDKVAQIISFQTMKARGALKDVLRAYGSVTFDEMNRITEPIPDEAKIADQLQEMKEETGESSIIRWALENKADELETVVFS